MLKRIFSFLKASLQLTASCIKAMPKLTYSCMKGFALFMLCCLLLVTLVESLPYRGVMSTQVEKNLPKLKPSENYDYRRSIVRLYREDRFFCSGVVVGGNYLLTASHCLVDEDGHINSEEIKVVNDDGSVVVKAKAVGINLRLDWGLIRGDFSKIPGALVVETGFNPLPAVAACGYPQGAKALTCQVLMPYVNDGFLIKCRPGGMLFPGMSGGPVFDGEGHLVGLNVQVYKASSGGGTAYSPTTGILACFGIAD